MSAQPSPLAAQTCFSGARAQSSVPINSAPDSGAPCLEPREIGTGSAVVQPYTWGLMKEPINSRARLKASLCGKGE